MSGPGGCPIPTWATSLASGQARQPPGEIPGWLTFAVPGRSCFYLSQDATTSWCASTHFLAAASGAMPP